MPVILKPCIIPGCGQYADGSRHCAQHRQAFDKQRGTRQARGYDNRWLKVRMLKLRRNPLCEDCYERGRHVPARQVHHMKPIERYPELRLNLDNLKSLCIRCHAKRTAKRRSE